MELMKCCGISVPEHKNKLNFVNCLDTDFRWGENPLPTQQLLNGICLCLQQSTWVCHSLPNACLRSSRAQSSDCTAARRAHCAGWVFSCSAKLSEREGGGQLFVPQVGQQTQLCSTVQWMQQRNWSWSWSWSWRSAGVPAHGGGWHTGRQSRDAAVSVAAHHPPSPPLPGPSSFPPSPSLSICYYRAIYTKGTSHQELSLLHVEDRVLQSC